MECMNAKLTLGVSMIRLACLCLVLAVVFGAGARADTDAAVRMLETGDYPGGRAAFEIEAPKGDFRAMYYLGVMSEEGKGGDANYSRAAAWYRRAAEQGFAPAQTRLGTMLLLGYGIDPDIRSRRGSGSIRRRPRATRKPW